MEHVDVAIVGGGPAGSSAGAAAAAEGANTVIFEKGVPRNDREDLGPDSTDAAGFLDYWVDIAELDYRDIPDDVVLCELDRAEFIGPNEQVVMHDTGIDASYPGFGFTFHRARFDDWLRRRAENTGADYRVGQPVRDVNTDRRRGHTLTLGDGEQVRAEHLVLADGPQRRVTMPVLDQFLPKDRKVSEVLNPSESNHIAYQEYRRIPEDVFESDSIKFWWGWIPGETAYPWVFPNDGNVARVGLTMPISRNLDEVENPEEYRLLRPDDDQIPKGDTYIRRLLREVYPRYDLGDFPLVEDRGKKNGTETYSISSARPIDSPTKVGIAVAGGAMGTTSAYHEGGGHVAIRTGKLAGKLAGQGNLDRYNDAWRRAIGDELLRNITMADMVKDYRPADWDRVFATASRAFAAADRLVETYENATLTDVMAWARAAGLDGFRYAADYQWRKFKFGNHRYIQLTEDEYRF